MARFAGPRKNFSGIGITGYGYCDVSLNNFKTDLGASTIPIQNYQFYYNGTGIGEKEVIRLNSLVGNDFRTSIEDGSSAYIVNFPGWFQIEENYFEDYPWLSGPSPSPTWGLFAKDSKQLLVRSNRFYNSLLFDAMHINNVNDAMYCQNVVDDYVNYGFHAINNNNIDLAQTQFGIAEYGLYLQKPATVDPIIGLQNYRKNCWASSFLVDAFNEATTTSNILSSKFDVPTSSCELPTYSPAIWFVLGIPTHTDTCESEPAPWLEMRSNGEELSWDSELQWYQIIHKRGASNDFESDFIASLEETAIPELVENEDQINEAVYIDDEQDAEIRTLSANVFNLRSQVDSIYSENDGADLSPEDSTAVAELLSLIELSSIELYSIIDGLNSGNTAVLNALLTDLNGISTESPQESTYKSYLKLVIGVALNGINNEDNIALAQELAVLDEGEYGSGASKASHFLPFDDYQAYVMEEVAICKGNHDDFHAPQGQVESNNQKGWLLEQNGFRNYSLEFKGEQETTYLLFGINGNLVSSGVVVPGVNDYNFKNLPTGYYVFKLRNGTQIQRLFFEP